LTEAGDLTLSAVSDQTVDTEAKNGAAGGGTSVGGAIALSVSENDTAARIDASPSALSVGELSVTSDLTSSVTTTADGNAAGDTAIGMALALTVASDSSLATTGRNISAGGAATFSARGASSSKSTAKAGAQGAEGDSEGGPSVNDQVAANQSFGTSRANAASDTDDDTTETPGAASADESSGNSVSVAAAVGVNVVNADTEALVNANVASTGTLTVRTSADADSIVEADGTSAGGGTGVGAAVALNVADVDNKASIAGGKTISAGGVVVEAKMDDDAGDATDGKHTFKAEATSGAGGSDVGVAGSLAINIGLSEATATIGDNATVTITGTGNDVGIAAENFVENTARAAASQEGASGSGSVGI